MKIFRVEIGALTALLACIAFGVVASAPLTGRYAFAAGSWSEVSERSLSVSFEAPFKKTGRPFFFPQGDDNEHPARSQLRLLINGEETGPPHTDHQSIRERGGGAFSHWGEGLLFSWRSSIPDADAVQSVEVVWPLFLDRSLFVALALGLGGLAAALALLSLTQRFKLTKAQIAFGISSASAIVLAVLAAAPLEGRLSIDPQFVVDFGNAGRSAQFVFPNGKPITFPGPDVNGAATRSTLQLYVNGFEAGPAHTDHASIGEKGGGGFSHWGDGLVFSIPAEVGAAPITRLDVRWPLVTNRWLAGVVGVIAALLATYFATQALPASRAPILKARDSVFALFRNKTAAAISAGVLAAFGAVAAIASSPEMPLLQLDTGSWLGPLPVAPPYYGWLYGSFDSLLRAVGLEHLESIVVLNSILMFGGLGFLGAVIALRSSFPWFGLLAILLVLGADSVTIYALVALTEAPSIAVILATLACVTMSGPGKPSWSMAAGVLAVFGAAMRPALIFLIPLFVVALLAIRLPRRELLRSVGAFTVALLIFNVAIPAIRGQQNANQLGLTMYAHAYLLVPPGRASPTPSSSEMSRALSASVESIRQERALISDPTDRFWFDTNALVRVSLAAQQTADSLGPREKGSVNDAMRDASLEIVGSNPLGFAGHILEHLYHATKEYAALWKMPWYGENLERDYLGSAPAARQLENALGRDGFDERLPTLSAPDFKGPPPLFDLTQHLLPPLATWLLLVAVVVVSIGLSISALFRRLEGASLAMAASGAAFIGYLLISAIASPIIPRYFIIAEAILLPAIVILAWTVSTFIYWSVRRLGPRLLAFAIGRNRRLVAN